LKTYLLAMSDRCRRSSSDQIDILSGGDDMTARRWKVADRTVLQTFAGHTGAVFDLAVKRHANSHPECRYPIFRLFPRAKKTPEQLAVKDVRPTTTIKHPAIVRSVTASSTQFSHRPAMTA